MNADDFRCHICSAFSCFDVYLLLLSFISSCLSWTFDSFFSPSADVVRNRFLWLFECIASKRRLVAVFFCFRLDCSSIFAVTDMVYHKLAFLCCMIYATHTRNEMGKEQQRVESTGLMRHAYFSLFLCVSLVSMSVVCLSAAEKSSN